jgi:hypothetical protein
VARYCVRVHLGQGRQRQWTAPLWCKRTAMSIADICYRELDVRATEQLREVMLARSLGICCHGAESFVGKAIIAFPCSWHNSNATSMKPDPLIPFVPSLVDKTYTTCTDSR